MTHILAALIRIYCLQKTRPELHALSDHMLRDIGLRREQISSEFLERVLQGRRPGFPGRAQI